MTCAGTYTFWKQGSKSQLSLTLQYKTSGQLQVMIHGVEGNSYWCNATTVWTFADVGESLWVVLVNVDTLQLTSTRDSEIHAFHARGISVTVVHRKHRTAVQFY